MTIYDIDGRFFERTRVKYICLKKITEPENQSEVLAQQENAINRYTIFGYNRWDNETRAEAGCKAAISIFLKPFIIKLTTNAVERCLGYWTEFGMADLYVRIIGIRRYWQIEFAAKKCNKVIRISSPMTQLMREVMHSFPI